ncbi:hypothetical protein J1614_009475 [Plenodomus biglobosus]|nr:hypothetical protein J1614_009475 [Plenodomus biglobosus]
MANNMSINSGFKALAYPASNLSDHLSPCHCSLIFRCDAAANKATVLLVAPVPTASGTETFVLQYNADDLVSGAVSLSSGNNHIERPQLDHLLRDKDNKRSDIKTLTLSVNQPCPIWCPHPSSFAPRPGSEPCFQRLVDLSKATKIHIVFDYKFLQKRYQGIFKAFSKAAKGLTGYPVEGFLTGIGLRKATWEVFGPVDDAGAPPAYENLRKRSQRANSISPSRSPKRFAPQSPTPSYTSGTTIADSPATAKAVEAAFSKPPVLDDQIEAINAAVKKQLPARLEQILPSLLSDILPTLFASLPDSDLNKPGTSLESLGTSLPKLPPLTPLGYALLPHLTKHLADEFQEYQTHQLKQFQKLLNRLSDSAEDTRAHENAEMEESREEFKTDMMLLKNDAIEELSAEVDAVFAEARQERCDLSDELTQSLESVFVDMRDLTKRLKRRRLKKMIAIPARKRVRRRKSMPRGVPIGMRKKREAELEQWVDC